MRERLQRARLYFVTDAEGDFERLVAAALRGGVDVVQLRAKEATDEEIVTAGRVFRRLCSREGALFVLNDRPDLAVACDADGVHVGQGDAPVAAARAAVGAERLVGLSTHSPEEIETAEGADYLGVGPVFATPTKPDGEPVGLDLVRHAAAHATVPWFAIGGIDLETVGEVAAAGATRVAAVRAIRDAQDPESAARALRSACTDPGV